jgi:hypothetical protein
MTVHKHNVLIDCKRCVCNSSNEDLGFEVSVPVCDSKTDLCINARLFCSVSADKHQIELRDWKDDVTGVSSLSPDLEARISETITFIADHKICGNNEICPEQVVKIVDKLSR